MHICDRKKNPFNEPIPCFINNLYLTIPVLKLVNVSKFFGTYESHRQSATCNIIFVKAISYFLCLEVLTQHVRVKKQKI